LNELGDKGRDGAAQVRLRLAFVHLRQGRPDSSRPLIDSVMEYYTDKYGKDDPRIAEPLYYLTTALLPQFDYETAEPLAKKQLRLLSGNPKGNALQIAECLTALTIIARGMGKEKEAREYETQCLTILEGKLGKSDHRVLLQAGRV